MTSKKSYSKSKSSFIWGGFPVLNLLNTEYSFDGTIYFLPDLGLGDLINSLRIIVDIRETLPFARCIVYIDPRWDEFLSRINGVEKRYLPRGVDVRNPGEGNKGFESAFLDIHAEIEHHPGKVFLGLAPFALPDQFARGESVWESYARAVSLFSKKRPWPFVPLLEEDRNWARKFLSDNHLTEGNFIFLSPLTWPDRMWEWGELEKIFTSFYREEGLRTVVAGFREGGMLNIPGSVHCFDLSIAQVAGIMSYSKIFVGHDSGLAHMAAGLDIPSVVIYVSDKKPPFEVRPISPIALLITSLAGPHVVPPSREIVMSAVRHQLLHGKSCQSHLPTCQACRRVMQYVFDADGDCLVLGCVCGTSQVIPIKEGNQHSLEPDRDIKERELEEIGLAGAENLELIGKGPGNGEAVMVHLRDLNPENRMALMGHRTNSKKFKVSFDGLLLVMFRRGFAIDRLEETTVPGSEKIKITFSKQSRKKKFLISWGGRRLSVDTEEYLALYSWRTWANFDRLEGIPKVFFLAGAYGKAFRLSKKLFFFHPNMKNLKWMMRSLFKSLFAAK